MNNLRRIYFDLVNGNVLVEVSYYGHVISSDVSKDISDYEILSLRNPDTFDYIELNYTDLLQDFEECTSYRVNPDTRQLEFSYPDPNEIEPSEPMYIVPLSEQVAANNDYLLDVDFRLMMVELGLI